MRKLPLPTLLTASIVVLVLLAFALTFQVRFSEVAVQVRLGQVHAVINDPGLRPRWPWPIDSIKKYDKRLKTLDTTEAEITTRDGKNVIVSNYTIWRIEDPDLFYRNVRDVAKAETWLRTRVNQRRAAVIGNLPLSAFVSLNPEQVEQNYRDLEEQILNGTQGTEGDEGLSLRDKALKDFGIAVEEVSIRRISLPDSTTRSVFQQMTAERQKEAARFREEGKAVAESITGAAENARKAILAFVEAKAQEERSKGVQAATRLLAQIEQEDVKFFEWLRQLDALRISLQQRATIFLDGNSFPDVSTTMFERFIEPPKSLESPTTQDANGG